MEFLLSILVPLLWSLAFAADPQQLAEAGIDGNAKATYFVDDGYVFALNVVENGDVYYHMNAYSSHSWIGVGFGGSMVNNRMLVSYISADGHNLTNSCRMSYDHSEPVYDPDCIIEPVVTDYYAPFHNTLSPDGILIVHAVCRNCSSWLGGALDVTSTEQPFIYALGPNTTLHSDDLNAPLRLHESYGTFNMDMTQATNTTGDYGRVPAPQDPGLQEGHGFWAFANYYSSTPYDIGTIADWSPAAHAVGMCLAFILIFPFGALSLRLLRRPMFHAAAQMVGIAFVALGVGFGIYAAKLYNKSKHFNSVHQIVGITVCAALLLQIGLGLTHHVVFMRSGSRTVMGKVHRILGMSIMVLALVNGGLGFSFAGRSATAYAVVVAIMGIIFAALAIAIHFYNRQHTYKPEKEGYQGSDPLEGYEMRNASFTTKRASWLHTPRTPHFADQRWRDDPDNYRQLLTRTDSQRNVGPESLYADTPASETADPFRSKWEATPMP